MSSHRIAFCFSLLLLLILASDVGAQEERELILNGYWRKIFEEENRSPVNISYTSRYSTGLKTQLTDENTVMVAHTVDSNIQAGDILKVLSIGISYQFQHTTTSKIIRGSEIHRSREESVTFTVPGWTRLVRWQLEFNIGGVEYGYEHTMTVANSTEIPSAINATATVQLRKQIHWGLTPIRIKHKVTGRYMIVVTRKNWPAATLGLSTIYYYILTDSGNRGIRIKTLNTTFSGYHYLYSSDQRGLYFDEHANDLLEFRSSAIYRGATGYMTNPEVGKQYWYLSKSAPLYDRDVVTFRNNHFHNSYICHYTEGSTLVNLYCIENREDEWILEVV